MLLIFDCDGVLVDSELGALATLVEVMRESGRPMTLDACRDAFMGRHNDDILRGIEARIGRALPGGGPGLRKRILDTVLADLRSVDGVADVLRELDGPRCVASSSDRARITRLLEAAGLAPFFGNDIFSGMDVAHGKPAPDLFLHAAATMGAAPPDCIVIEDSVMGVEAAIAARMPVVGFTGGTHTDPGHATRLAAAGAAPIVAHMRDLPATLATLSIRATSDVG